MISKLLSAGSPVEKENCIDDQKLAERLAHDFEPDSFDCYTYPDSLDPAVVFSMFTAHIEQQPGMGKMLADALRAEAGEITVERVYRPVIHIQALMYRYECHWTHEVLVHARQYPGVPAAWGELTLDNIPSRESLVLPPRSAITVAKLNRERFVPGLQPGIYEYSAAQLQDGLETAYIRVVEALEATAKKIAVQQLVVNQPEYMYGGYSIDRVACDWTAEKINVYFVPFYLITIKRGKREYVSAYCSVTNEYELSVPVQRKVRRLAMIDLIVSAALLTAVCAVMLFWNTYASRHSLTWIEPLAFFPRFSAIMLGSSLMALAVCGTWFLRRRDALYEGRHRAGMVGRLVCLAVLFAAGLVLPFFLLA